MKVLNSLANGPWLPPRAVSPSTRGRRCAGGAGSRVPCTRTRPGRSGRVTPALVSTASPASAVAWRQSQSAAEPGGTISSQVPGAPGTGMRSGPSGSKRTRSHQRCGAAARSARSAATRPSVRGFGVSGCAGTTAVRPGARSRGQPKNRCSTTVPSCVAMAGSSALTPGRSGQRQHEERQQHGTVRRRGEAARVVVCGAGMRDITSQLRSVVKSAAVERVAGRSRWRASCCYPPRSVNGASAENLAGDRRSKVQR